MDIMNEAIITQGNLRVDMNVFKNSLKSNDLDYTVADRVTT